MKKLRIVQIFFISICVFIIVFTGNWSTEWIREMWHGVFGHVDGDFDLAPFMGGFLIGSLFILLTEIIFCDVFIEIVKHYLKVREKC